MKEKISFDEYVERQKLICPAIPEHALEFIRMDYENEMNLIDDSRHLNFIEIDQESLQYETGNYAKINLDLNQLAQDEIQILAFPSFTDNFKLIFLKDELTYIKKERQIARFKFKDIRIGYLKIDELLNSIKEKIISSQKPKYKGMTLDGTRYYFAFQMNNITYLASKHGYEEDSEIGYLISTIDRLTEFLEKQR